MLTHVVFPSFQPSPPFGGVGVSLLNCLVLRWTMCVFASQAAASRDVVQRALRVIRSPASAFRSVAAHVATMSAFTASALSSQEVCSAFLHEVLRLWRSGACASLPSLSIRAWAAETVLDILKHHSVDSAEIAEYGCQALHDIAMVCSANVRRTVLERIAAEGGERVILAICVVHHDQSPFSPTFFARMLLKLLASHAGRAVEDVTDAEKRQDESIKSRS